VFTATEPQLEDKGDARRCTKSAENDETPIFRLCDPTFGGAERKRYNRLEIEAFRLLAKTPYTDAG
jgi:hypothetical protein